VNYNRDELNQAALKGPRPGDYWHEMFCPYFLVVQVNGSQYTVLSCLGGPHSYNRKHEKNARVDVDNHSWEFDYSQFMVVDRHWIEKAVTYGTIPGFVADVVRGSEKLDTIVQGWIQYRAKTLLEEFNALGPEASKYLLERETQ